MSRPALFSPAAAAATPVRASRGAQAAPVVARVGDEAQPALSVNCKILT